MKDSKKPSLETIDENTEYYQSAEITPKPALKKKKTTKSVGFADDKNETHIVESAYLHDSMLDEDGYLKDGKYKSKSAGGDIPLEKSPVVELTPEQELAKFMSNFMAKTYKAYFANCMADYDKKLIQKTVKKKNKERVIDLDEAEANGHFDSFDEKYKDEKYIARRLTEDTSSPNTQINAEPLLKPDALIDACQAILEEEFKKVENEDIVGPYYSALKDNMKNYIDKMQDDLTPKIEKIIATEMDNDAHQEKLNTPYAIGCAIRDKFYEEAGQNEKNIDKQLSSPNKAKFYQGMARLCEAVGLRKSAESWLKKSINEQVKQMQKNFLSSQKIATVAPHKTPIQRDRGMSA